MEIFKRFMFEFHFEKTWNKPYQKFNILPVLLFIKDTQCIKPFGNEKAWLSYELWFDWFIWQSAIIVNIEIK